MGHETPLTTLLSYGNLTIERQAEIISGLANRQPAGESGMDEAMAEKIAEKVAAMLGKRKE